ncbi:MAG: Triosephosphate isomerase [Parcubacteria group bacterium GW2011_GWA2_49_9]|nr:MAG: Triosephosphate isomerase [Parcubacteria group bacterium GW2011_GWA2_49_9]
MRKKKLMVANWKMNPGSVAEARVLFGKTKLAGGKLDKVETVMCPPFPYLGLFAHAGTTRVSLGAQDVFWANIGRATGEVSPEMLKDVGASYVIVGHSERRALGETDEMVSKKLRAVLAEGLTPIVCVGEKERDVDGKYFDILKNQIKSSLAGIRRTDFREFVIAYEPLWAIGKSAREAMTPRDIRETSIFIRKVLADMYDATTAELPVLLYGGSAEGSNTAAILRDGGVSGLLVGHASLDASGFISMLKSANSI